MTVVNAVLLALWELPAMPGRYLTERILADEDLYTAIYEAVLVISTDERALHRLKEMV